MPHCPINGIKTGLGPAQGQVPLRREIDEWYQDPASVKQVNLFLQALARFQSTPANQKLSYYAVAGIHGVPNTTWDAAEDEQVDQNGYYYCAHGRVVFPTWHRPYLALYEQTIQNHMIDIAKDYSKASDAQEWKRAAEIWRLPYWDYTKTKPPIDSTSGSKPGLRIPLIIADAKKSIDIYLPTGATRSIPNPLWTYNFTWPQGMEDWRKISYISDGADYSQCKQVNRRAEYSDPKNPKTASQQWLDGVQNNGQVTVAFENQKVSLKGTLYKVINIPLEKYLAFSTQYRPYNSTDSGRNDPGFRDPQAPNRFLFENLEAFHGSIHGIIGGGRGHCGQVALSAFDPLFWFHHANIDRIFAIWQTIHPTKNNLWQNPINNDTLSTGLFPFRYTSANTLVDWKSTDCLDQKALGYTYPTLEPWSPKNQQNGVFNQDTYIANVKTAILADLDRAQELLWNNINTPLLRKVSTQSPSSAKMASAPAITENVKAMAMPALQTAQNMAQKVMNLENPFKETGATSKDATPRDSIVGSQSTSTHAQTQSSASVKATTQGSATPDTGAHTASTAQPVATMHSTSATTPAAHNVSSTSTARPSHIEFDDWVANVKFERFALNGKPFTVYIFLGDFDKRAEAAPGWIYEIALVGTVYNFVSELSQGTAANTASGAFDCENCAAQAAQGLVVTGQVTLTTAIIKAIMGTYLETPESLLDRQGITQFLKKNLTWRVTTPEGDLPREAPEIQSLEVSVAVAKATSPNSPSEFTSYGQYTTVYEITEGRPCGASGSAAHTNGA